jgi:hypothetical protein
MNCKRCGLPVLNCDPHTVDGDGVRHVSCTLRTVADPLRASAIEDGRWDEDRRRRVIEQEAAERMGRVMGSAPRTVLVGSAEEDRLIGQMLGYVLKARKAITDQHGTAKPTRGDVRGELPCPVCCKGTLTYRIASFNGHIAAQCSNARCVRWIE